MALGIENQFTALLSLHAQLPVTHGPHQRALLGCLQQQHQSVQGTSLTHLWPETVGPRLRAGQRGVHAVGDHVGRAQAGGVVPDVAAVLRGHKGVRRRHRLRRRRVGEHPMFGGLKVSAADTCWPLTAWQTLSTCASTPRWKQGHSAARHLGFVLP